MERVIKANDWHKTFLGVRQQHNYMLYRLIDEVLNHQHIEKFVEVGTGAGALSVVLGLHAVNRGSHLLTFDTQVRGRKPMLDRVFDATGRAKGYRWHTWNTSATNDSDTPVNITGVGLFMGAGGTPLDFQWITGAGLIEPGQTITDSVTMGAAVTGSASISSVWIRGICRDCVVELPPDFGSGSFAGVPEPVDPDVFCQGFRTQSGFDTCKGVVQALENDGQIDIDTQRLAGVTCDDLPFAERQTCRVVVAVETGDKSRLEGLGDEALALYVIMSGDRSVLERISSDSVRDAAYAYLGVVGAARDPANTPPTDYCEGLTLTIDDDDFLGDACEVGVATIRAFNNNDLGECDRLLETMQPYIERYGDPETPFEAQFLCQQHVADMRTLESKFQ